jgi:hypothetical protein
MFALITTAPEGRKITAHRAIPGFEHLSKAAVFIYGVAIGPNASESVGDKHEGGYNGNHGSGDNNLETDYSKSIEAVLLELLQELDTTVLCSIATSWITLLMFEDVKARSWWPVKVDFVSPSQLSKDRKSLLQNLVGAAHIHRKLIPSGRHDATAS